MTRPADTACPVHHTGTTDQTWDSAAAERALTSPMTVATARGMYAWYDAVQIDADQIPKDACRLPHHEVTLGGQPALANMVAVRAALSQLPSSDIPEGEQGAAERHLQAHLDDTTARLRRAPHNGRGGAVAVGEIRINGMEEYLTARRAKPEALTRAAGKSWYRVEAEGGSDSAKISIYDEISWFGITAADFLDELNALDVSNLEVQINSPGGDVFDGVAIYNGILKHPARVTTVVDGLAASICSVIAQAGDDRLVCRASQTMIHEASALTVGNAEDHRKSVAMLDQVSNMIAMVYADRAGGSVKYWRDLMRQETWYSSDEAKTAGLADAIYGESTAAAAEAVRSWDLSMFAHPGRKHAPAPPAVPASRATAHTDVGFRYDPDVFKAALFGAFHSDAPRGGAW
jgi:ATP-dependent protease ClpP protease subunit